LKSSRKGRFGAARVGPSLDYKAKVRQAVLTAGGFTRLTFAGGRATAPGSSGPAEEKVSLRPVAIRGRTMVQVLTTAGKRHVAENLAGDELAARLEQLLAEPFTHVELQCPGGDLHVRITRKGKALVSQGKPSRPDAAVPLGHDRRKDYLLPAEGGDEFLRGVGIVGPSGKVKAEMYPKFRQIHEFLRVLDPIARRLAEGGRGLSLLDCGCGNAYLTFAAAHFLRRSGIEVQAVGVDVEASLIRKCTELRDRLGWSGLDFQAGSIAGYRPRRPPDIVVCLHACDTATDEALAAGARWGCGAILAAPCCQHELHRQLDSPAFRAVLRHGLLRERLADLLTDALRAAALRVAGYDARVFEFISPEATTKNLMIAAERVDRPASARAAAAREYLELKRFWNVVPFIEKALGEGFQDALATA
jgi:SAM-dependent methyltransferase